MLSHKVLFSLAQSRKVRFFLLKFLRKVYRDKNSDFEDYYTYNKNFQAFPTELFKVGNGMYPAEGSKCSRTRKKNHQLKYVKLAKKKSIVVLVIRRNHIDKTSRSSCPEVFHKGGFLENLTG